MGCILLLIILAFPRVVLVLTFLFSNYLERAYHHALLLPLLGFLFLPVTTLVYAWEVNSGYPTSGMYLLVLLIAVLIDVGGHGGAYQRRRW